MGSPDDGGDRIVMGRGWGEGLQRGPVVGVSLPPWEVPDLLTMAGLGEYRDKSRLVMVLLGPWHAGCHPLTAAALPRR